MNEWPLVWCSSCRKLVEYIRDVLPANKTNNHDGLDIVCNECHLVIVTFHKEGVDHASLKPDAGQRSGAS